MAARLVYNELRHVRPDLAADLDRVYEQAVAIWKGQHLRKFTTHDEPHFTQVEANLDSLTRPLQTSPTPLAPQEIYVLLAACWLHDIGMQLDEPDARARHAQYAYELVLYSSAQVGPEERRVTLPITDDNAREAIALVARAHWTEFALQLEPSGYLLGNLSGRLRLLGALLATADLLDLSPERARYFRTIHRLYDLDAVGELHQKMHRWVRGYQIEPADKAIPGDLQFKLQWRDNHPEVRDAADWVLRWFTSQWRQLDPILHEDSGGVIRWANPWLKVRFDEPAGPRTRLSEGALQVLRAERLEQRRLNRDAFANAFKQAMKGQGNSLFVASGDSDWDGRALRDWCESQARIAPGCRVARINVPPAGRLDRVSVVAQMLEQWDEHLPICSEGKALGRLRDFLSTSAESPLVALLTVGDYQASGVDEVVRTYLCGDAPGSRVCVLLTEGASGPEVPEHVKVYRLADDPYSESDILKFLREHLGYAEQDCRLRLTELKASRNMARPEIVREMMEQREIALLGLG